MTRPITTTSTMDIAVAPCRVLDHAKTAVKTVATRLWAGESVRVGPQLPSVTNYVTSLRVRGRSFVAKYSLLGTSLVSVVRGLRGAWPEVETSQQDYIADHGAQLAQEYAQLRILAAVARRGTVPLQVPKVIAYEAGVLITVAVTAPSLSTELLGGSQRPDELLMSRVFAEHSDTAVLGVGSNLDSARYRTLVAHHLAVPCTAVSGSVLGEHGETAVICEHATRVHHHPVQLPLGIIRQQLRERSPRITAGMDRTQHGPAGAVLSTVRKLLGLAEGHEERSAICRADKEASRAYLNPAARPAGQCRTRHRPRHQRHPRHHRLDHSILRLLVDCATHHLSGRHQ